MRAPPPPAPSCASPFSPTASALKARGNAAFAERSFAAAVGLYTDALERAASPDERAVLLVNRANARFSNGELEGSREDALAALDLQSTSAKAMHRLAAAERALGRPVAALAACAAGAQHGDPETYFAFFTQQARQLGAWRLPPPLQEWPAGSKHWSRDAARVEAVAAAGRAEFLPFVERGEPVVLRGFADVSGWSWCSLVDHATAAETAGRRVSGEVLVSATGVVPDYPRGGARGDSAHASSMESMTSVELSLAELFARASGEAVAAGSEAVGGAAEGGSGGGGDGGGAPLAAAPLLARFEKVYSYGKCWMLADAGLRAQAQAAWPDFLDTADLHIDEGDAAGGEPRTGSHGASGQVCWVSSAGCLTPLHYDMSDGLLGQVLGHKRVWLFPPTDADRCYLRSASRA